MQQYLQNKKGLVQNIFDQVYDRYDLMNDFMSLGIHRIWKKNFINMMNPTSNKKLIDVACGTGDIGKLYLNYTGKNSKITCVDPNEGMIMKGKEKLANYFPNTDSLASINYLDLSHLKLDYLSDLLTNLNKTRQIFKEEIKEIDHLFTMYETFFPFEILKDLYKVPWKRIGIIETG